MQREMRTLIDDRSDRRWGATFLSILCAIPLAGLFGLPMLCLLLFLFLANPGGLGERIGRSWLLKDLPGFRSGHCGHMALAAFLYLLPLSLLGMIVIGVDCLILGVWP